jgi:glycosyltransferase involved in cell wall biosynthesis
MPRADAVTVVVPTYNGAPYIAAQLGALAQQDYDGDWEIVVVDDCSTDGTADVVAEWLPKVPQLRLHRCDRSHGAAHARNTGSRIGRHPLLLFCDQDDVVGTGWVTAMVRGLARYDAVGGHCERRSLNDDVALATRPEKPVGSLQGGFGFLPYALCANCGVRRAVWEHVGGYNETYGASEDVDFFWRVQLAGFRMGAVPDAIVHYRLRRDIPSMVRQYYWYGTSHPRLYRDHAAAGMPRRGEPPASRVWWWLLTHLPDLGRSRPARAVWLTRCAMRWGRLVGSVRHRIRYL